MQCLQCNGDTLPGKALCPVCLEAASLRKQAAVGGYKQELSLKKKTISFDRAPHGLRFLAFVLDSLIYALLSNIIFILLHFLLIPSYEIPSLYSLQAIKLSPYVIKYIGTVTSIQTFAAVSAICFCFVWLESSSWKASVAKKILGLKLYSESGVTFAESFKRNILKYLPVILPLILLQVLKAGCFGRAELISLVLGLMLISLVLTVANPVAILFTDGNRSIADMIAGTRVVKNQSVDGVKIVLVVFMSVLILLLLFAIQALSYKYLYNLNLLSAAS